MKEWITLEEVYAAYLQCRKRKRKSRACIEFAAHEARNIYSLYWELNNKKYKIGKSITFCVTRPKIREVFAADFRDRIVHHIIMERLNVFFEEKFIDNTFNCRVGKGTLYGGKCVQKMIAKYPDLWILRLDLKGFFMSIDKELLADKLEAFIRDKYKKEDVNNLIELVRQVVMHKPQENCEKHGNVHIWKDLSLNKSLFTCKEGYGLAIGNLTSQIFANFYLSDFDEWAMIRYSGLYARYVDDMIVIGEHEILLHDIDEIKRKLKDECRVILNPKKVYLQPCKHGVLFIGSVSKLFGTYIGGRTIHNVRNMIRLYNTVALKKSPEIWIERFAQRMNSYYGFLIQHLSYRIRREIWDSIGSEIKQYIYLQNTAVVRVKKRYLQTTKTYNAYVCKHSKKKRIRSISGRRSQQVVY